MVERKNEVFGLHYIALSIVALILNNIDLINKSVHVCLFYMSKRSTVKLNKYHCWAICMLRKAKPLEFKRDIS